jgi:hypothetical protein
MKHLEATFLLSRPTTILNPKLLLLKQEIRSLQIYYVFIYAMLSLNKCCVSLSWVSYFRFHGLEVNRQPQSHYLIFSHGDVIDKSQNISEVSGNSKNQQAVQTRRNS